MELCITGLHFCVVGNAVCRTWESGTFAFPCAVNGVIHDAIACYAQFHDAKPLSLCLFFLSPALLREKPPACDVLGCIAAGFVVPFL